MNVHQQCLDEQTQYGHVVAVRLTEEQRAPDTHWILLILSLLAMASVLQVNLLLPLLPRVGETFDVGPPALGWLQGAGAATIALVAPWAGSWADRRGWRPAMIIGMGIQAIGLVVQTLSVSFIMLLLARVFTALGGAFLVGTSLSYISYLYPPIKRGRVLGLLGGMEAMGLVLAVPAAAFFGGVYGFRWPLGIFAVCMIGLWLLAVVKLPITPTSPDVQVFRLSQLLEQRERRALIFTAFLDGLVLEGALTMFPLWLELVLSWGSDDVALIFLLVGCSLVVFQPVAGVLTDRLGRVRIQLVGACGGAAVWACLPFTEGALLEVCALSALWAAFMAMSMNARLSLTSVLVNPSTQGAFMGIFTSAWAAGACLGAVVAGQVFERWGFSCIALLTALALSIGGIVVWTFVREPGVGA